MVQVIVEIEQYVKDSGTYDSCNKTVKGEIEYLLLIVALLSAGLDT